MAIDDLGLLTPDAAAAALHVSQKTLAAWRCKGKGPPYTKVGHRVAYRPKDLGQFIEQNVRRSTSEAKPKSP